jgi:transposase-like protein
LHARLVADRLAMRSTGRRSRAGRHRRPKAIAETNAAEVVIGIAGKKYWLWCAVDQDGFVLDVLVQSRRDKKAAKRLLRKLLQGGYTGQ